MKPAGSAKVIFQDEIGSNSIAPTAREHHFSQSVLANKVIGLTQIGGLHSNGHLPEKHSGDFANSLDFQRIESTLRL